MNKAGKKERYLVRWDGITPALIRLDPSDEMNAYRLESQEYSCGLCWVHTPVLDGIADHPERFPEYQEITGEEAAEVESRIQEEWDRQEKERTRTCVKRTRRKTEDGTADVEILRKVSKWRYFSLKEYMEILLGMLNKKGMVLQGIEYSWYDEWGYEKYHSIKSKAELRQLYRDCPQEIEARFSDREKQYVLRATFMFWTIELETRPKKKKAGPKEEKRNEADRESGKDPESRTAEERGKD